jgi:hypothetical protein
LVAASTSPPSAASNIQLHGVLPGAVGCAGSRLMA